MQHVITLGDIMEASGIALLIFAVVGTIVWFLSQLDFSK